MIARKNYSNLEYSLRYLFLKFLPKLFYPLVLDYFYEKKFGRKLNLKNPQLFSEKILHSCIYDKNPKKTLLADKLQAKDYVKKIIPDLNCAKVFQVASSFDKLDFENAPKTFVIKTNHAWKSHVLVKDKNQISEEDYKDYREYYKRVLGINYAYWGTPELQYKDIKPKVFLEEYLNPNEDDPFLYEYEVYCFKGEPLFISYVISELEIPDPPEMKDYTRIQDFYPNWEKADFEMRYCNDLPQPKSKNRDLVLEYAKILSKEFDFVRIDFFEVNDKLYFGEYTFTPQSGFIKFNPPKYDLIYGEKC